MNGSAAREIISNNMDAMSLLYDVKDILEISLKRINKIINSGREANRELEVNCRQKVA